MTLAEGASLATIVASIVAIIALAIIAWQAWAIRMQAGTSFAQLEIVAQQAQAIRDQVDVSLAQLDEFTQRARIDLSYQMLTIYGEPTFNRHLYDAWRILSNKSLSSQQLLERLENVKEPFRFDFRLLCTYMENLAIMYFNDHVDRDVIWMSLYRVVILHYQEAEGLIGQIRNEHGSGALRQWQELAREFERRGPPDS